MLCACSPAYVLKQGYFQAKLLSSRKPIAQLLEDKNVSDDDKKALRFVDSVRQFAHEKLSLTASTIYTTANLTWDHNPYNVSASEALRFLPYTWWFPIVGTVPYIGFFNPNDAKAEKKYLQRKGYDVMVYRVSAYSSLGYFSDPITSSMLHRSQIELADLVIHELAHATVFFSGQIDFNESFATFVGREGAKAYFHDHEGEQGKHYHELVQYYHDEDLYNQFMHEVFSTLDMMYKSNINDDDKHEKKQKIIAVAIKRYTDLPFLTRVFHDAKPTHMNNAYLMSFQRYNTSQAEFSRIFEKTKRNWRQFIELMSTIKHDKNPLLALERLAR